MPDGFSRGIFLSSFYLDENDVDWKDRAVVKFLIQDISII